LKLQIKDKIKREFNLALIEIESEEKKIPSLDFTSLIEMASQDFSEVIEDCSVVADSCSFISEINSFTIKAKGSLNSFKSEFSSDEINIRAENASSKYSLEYLQKMTKATKLTDKIKISFSTDYPLRLDFTTPFIELGFILAPRVDSES
jgi:proliferating cell nuclear antigen